MPLHELVLIDLVTDIVIDEVLEAVTLTLAPSLGLELILGVKLGLGSGAPILLLALGLTVILLVTDGVGSALAPTLLLTLMLGVILLVILGVGVMLTLPINIPPTFVLVLIEGVTDLVLLTLNKGVDLLTLFDGVGVRLTLGTMVQSCVTVYILDLQLLTVAWNDMAVLLGILTILLPLMAPTPETICIVGLPTNTIS